MTHTKKRILAMLLAVVLMFSALPFSVSADELPGELSTESTVESQPEETPAEDSTPSDGETAESSPSENRSITISDSSGDVPVLYAQDPFNTVKSEVEGGTNYMTSVGVTRESIVRELEALAKRLNEEKEGPVKAPRKNQYYEEAQLAVGEYLNRKVKVAGSKKKGTLQIEFYGEEDLQNLLHDLHMN